MFLIILCKLRKVYSVCLKCILFGWTRYSQWNVWIDYQPAHRSVYAQAVYFYNRTCRTLDNLPIIREKIFLKWKLLTTLYIINFFFLCNRKIKFFNKIFLICKTYTQLLLLFRQSWLNLSILRNTWIVQMYSSESDSKSYWICQNKAETYMSRVWLNFHVISSNLRFILNKHNVKLQWTT